jgi:hypothetical protein|nr:MAG TPA: hypothetical protein [Caudoviricetes sp.]
MARNKKQNSPKVSFLRDACTHDTYKDIKRKAIALGMPFPDATGNSIGALLNFINKTDNIPDPTLIDKYDDWMDNQLSELGYEKDDPIRSSRLRLGFLGDEDENGKPKIRRVPGIKRPKEKKPVRERDKFSLYKGTKKSYTFELTEKGLSLDRITRRVLKKFPDAKEKSISLWHRACLRELKKKNG